MVTEEGKLYRIIFLEAGHFETNTTVPSHLELYEFRENWLSNIINAMN